MQDAVKILMRRCTVGSVRSAGILITGRRSTMSVSISAPHLMTAERLPRVHRRQSSMNSSTGHMTAVICINRELVSMRSCTRCMISITCISKRGLRLPAVHRRGIIRREFHLGKPIPISRRLCREVLTRRGRPAPMDREMQERVIRAARALPTGRADIPARIRPVRPA